ncbi:hypothetical protein KAH55_07675 [bacterium]|nr:hypothetical protein [bacterium]
MTQQATVLLEWEIWDIPLNFSDKKSSEKWSFEFRLENNNTELFIIHKAPFYDGDLQFTVPHLE